jgi:hypothetical protein
MGVTVGLEVAVGFTVGVGVIVELGEGVGDGLELGDGSGVGLTVAMGVRTMSWMFSPSFTSTTSKYSSYPLFLAVIVRLPTLRFSIRYFPLASVTSDLSLTVTCTSSMASLVAASVTVPNSAPVSSPRVITTPDRLEHPAITKLRIATKTTAARLFFSTFYLLHLLVGGQVLKLTA